MYNYLISSKNDFPEPEQLVKEFEKHGFKCIKICNYLFGTISAQIMQKQ
jgi:ubiquinone/menaquinone biosynthesis C-methylase UbiE